jgi:NAD(P)H dehydrogenase (quinone)
MTRRVWLVSCHPLPDSLTAAAVTRALTGLALAGHQVRHTDLYADDFDPSMPADERRLHLAAPDTKPAIADYVERLRWCDTIVFVYPTWWTGQPAMLKGLIDRTFVNGVAWELPPGADRLRPKLHNVRRLVVITTHGSSKWVNALEGEAGKRIITRAIRVLCHPLARTTWIALYRVDQGTADQRRRFLDRVEARMARLR